MNTQQPQPQPQTVQVITTTTSVQPTVVSQQTQQAQEVDGVTPKAWGLIWMIVSMLCCFSCGCSSTIFGIATKRVYFILSGIGIFLLIWIIFIVTLVLSPTGVGIVLIVFTAVPGMWLLIDFIVMLVLALQQTDKHKWVCCRTGVC